MEPYIGQAVHYVAYGTPGGEFPTGVCRAAIVTEIGRATKTHIVTGGGMEVTEAIGLCVLNASGMFFNVAIPYDADHKPGSWHYAPCC